MKKGLDVRRDDVLGHLGSVGDDRLAGLVLSGCVDRMTIVRAPPPAACWPSSSWRPAGRSPCSSSRRGPGRAGGTGRGRLSPPVPVARRDVGVPPGTARLHRRRERRGPGIGGLVVRHGGHWRRSTTAVLNDALERLEPLVSGPEPFCVIATKPHPRRWIARERHAAAGGDPAADVRPR